MIEWSFTVGSFGGHVRLGRQTYDWGYRLSFDFEVTRFHV
jgi:hypothetical protein